MRWFHPFVSVDAAPSARTAPATRRLSASAEPKRPQPRLIWFTTFTPTI